LGWGTFQSSISKLHEISGMGFNAIELLPVTQFAAIHGNPYGPTDPYAVDNDQYGGPDNLKAFVDACHQQGLAVILDVVHNHWGAFDIGAFDFDGWHTASFPGGIYFYDNSVSSGDPYDSPWGPRPDYSYPIVKNYILGQIAMWFDEYHADGLRWDSVANIYNAWAEVLARIPILASPEFLYSTREHCANGQYHVATVVQDCGRSLVQQVPVVGYAPGLERRPRFRFAMECHSCLFRAERFSVDERD